MAKELRSYDVGRVPELLRIAEEVRAAGEPRLLKRDGEELAVDTSAYLALLDEDDEHHTLAATILGSSSDSA